MTTKIKFYRFEGSTNAERVALVLSHKKLPVESIEVDPKDRSIIQEVSGQDLVPVIQDGDHVVYDSPVIIAYLDRTYPQHPLYPSDPMQKAQMEIFIEWFNRVWKRPPNEIADALESGKADPSKMKELSQVMKTYLHRFEHLLTDKEYLFGTFSAADCIAFPFLKYAHFHHLRDDYVFHQVLIDHQPLGAGFPNLKRWIELVDKRPRV